jgi:hypothetical protein
LSVTGDFRVEIYRTPRPMTPYLNSSDSSPSQLQLE